MSQNKNSYAAEGLVCPLRGQWISLRLVDEFGSGEVFGGLAYTVSDTQGQQYKGVLDEAGFVRLEDCYKGPVLLTLDDEYIGDDEYYQLLKKRPFYKLSITELQVRAEATFFFHQDGTCREDNPAKMSADEFIQVEVRDLVKQGAHLPPPVKRFYPPKQGALKAMIELDAGLEPSELWGIGLMPNKHTVLEVRPLRALRPILSTDNEFCALNLYQLALMSTMVYIE